ncbi:MAG: hypothetical protein Ta2A_25600 [Treponemataceae bacterium]|nr:MAG: hypothetical protein Ta2A_25600 [Treponemataceae bacterium]
MMRFAASLRPRVCYANSATGGGGASMRRMRVVAAHAGSAWLHALLRLRAVFRDCWLWTAVMAGALVAVSSCSALKQEALDASAAMVAQLLAVGGEEKLDGYLYRPSGEGTKPFALLRFSTDIETTEYWGAEFVAKYRENRAEYGRVVSYEIVKNEYKHYRLPLWDFGYPYGTSIELKCIYQNRTTTEYIKTYYHKDFHQIAIVDYMILE